MALVVTAYVMQRQTAALVNAAPASTPVVEFEPVPTSTVSVQGSAVAAPITGGQLINDGRFSYEPDWYAEEVQRFLQTQPGPLKDLRVPIGNREHSFAEFLISQTSLYSLNPKVVLALLEQQSQLLSTANPTQEQLDWAMGYHGEQENWRGVVPQTRWAMRELRRAIREYREPPDLIYADESHSPVPGGLSLGQYALTRLLAATSVPANLPAKLDQDAGSFAGVYSRLWGDPVAPPADWPGPAAPFLSRPTERSFAISSFFDHESPFLRENGSLVSYRGDRSTSLSYDGHTGWDYAMRPPDVVLAAADGRVVFAGNSDDGCGIAHAVIIDHGNGYRTLYWHLSEVLVEPGPVRRGERIGIVGESGCATGPHLHLQVQYLGRDTDPYGWCGPKSDDPWASTPGGQISTWLWSWMPSPCTLPDGAILVDNGDAGFKRSGAGWDEQAGGVGGLSLQATSVVTPSPEAASATWQPTVPLSGTYRVSAWIPYIDNGLLDASAVTYTVTSALGTTSVVVDQSATANTWVDLGTYPFEGLSGSVTLGAQDGANPTGQTNIWFDAMLWRKEP